MNNYLSMIHSGTYAFGMLQEKILHINTFAKLFERSQKLLSFDFEKVNIVNFTGGAISGLDLRKR